MFNREEKIRKEGRFVCLCLWVHQSRKKEFQQVRMNKNEMLFTTNRVKHLAAQHKEVCEEYEELQSALVEKAIQVQP